MYVANMPNRRGKTMTIAEAKQELRQYKSIMGEYRNLFLQLRDAALDTCVCGINISGMPSGNAKSNKIERRLEKIEELKEKIMKVEAESDKMIIKIKTKINRINNKKLSDLLYFRYIFMESWKEIGEYLKVSTDHAKGYLHLQALKAYCKV